MLLRSGRNAHRYIFFKDNRIACYQTYEKDRPGNISGLNACFSWGHISQAAVWVALAFFWGSEPALAELPMGYSTASGSATFQNDGTTLNIHASNGAIINYQSFNIGAHNTVNIFSPLTLNRVTGGSPSQIFGQLNSTGKVFLINPSGIIFGNGSSVNVQSLVASTLNLSNDNFLAGKYTFQSSADAPAGAIVNHGKITATDSVALLGGAIENTGTIQTPQVQIAVGDQITYQVAPGVGIDVTVDKSLQQQVAGYQTAIHNSGTITGEQVKLQAQLARSFYDTTVNNEGILKADGFALGTDGQIVAIGQTDDHTALVQNSGSLLADGTAGHVNGGAIHLEGDTTVNSGLIQATGTTGGVGGTVQMLGDKVLNLSGSNINVSGDLGGGTALIGGDYQGKNTLIRNALFNYSDTNTRVLANSFTKGNGGKIIYWADNKNVFQGQVEAKGGAQGGNGGFVETSGKNILQASGSVNALAAHGQAGQWLLDPNNITIQGTGSDTNIGNNAGTYSSSNDSAIVTASTIQSALNNGTSVTIQTTSSGSNTQIGNINIASGTQITKTSGGDTTLTLKAHNSILFNGTSGSGNGISIASTNNKLNLTLNSDTDQGSDGGVGGAIRLNYTNLTTNGGSVVMGGGLDPLNIPAMGGSSPKTAISLTASTLTTGIGDISMRGTAFSQAGSGGEVGINLDTGSVLSTTSGKISLYGTGGAGTSSNYGVCLTDIGTLITSNSGLITIWGKAGNGTGTLNIGTVMQAGAYVTSTGTGNGIGAINMTGIGGTGTASDHGIKFTGSGVDTGISSVNGNISLNGTGSVAGNGIFIQSAGKIASTGTATINLTGLTGTGADSLSGVKLDSAQIVSNVGSITVNGTSQAGVSYTDGYGVSLTNAAKITNNGTAAINITGTGNSGTSNSMGISLTSANTAISTKDAPIVLIGNGGSTATSTSNFGIQIGSGSQVISDGNTNNGTISLQGLGGSGTSSNYGIYITSAGSAINSVNGNIDLLGTGGNGSSSSNAGIVLDTNGAISSTGNATLTLRGIGGSTNTTNSNFGVYLNGGNTSGSTTIPKITSSTGAISITGQGGNGTSTANYGIYLKNGGQIASTGSAPITLSGTGGNGTNTNYGVDVDSTLSSSYVTGVNGQVSIAGTGNGTGNNNHGLYITGGSLLSTTGTGSLLLTGRAGTGASSVGLNTNTGSNILGSNTMTGNLSLIGDSYSLSNVQLRTAGQLTFKPYTSSLSMGLNGGAGTLQLGNTFLGLIDRSSVTPSRLVFGDATSGSGLVTIGTGWDISSYSMPLEVYGGNIATGSITSAKSLLLQARTGDLTLNSGTTLSSTATGNAITLAATQNFINNSGSSALSNPNGRWLVYSTNPTNITLGGLSSYIKRYNRTFSGNAPSTISESGNVLMYSLAPTLTIAASNQSKTYGASNPTLTGTITGLIDGDTSSTAYTGAASYSTGATSSSNVGTYSISAGLGTLASAFGYQFATSNGTLTVNPAPLTVTANDASRNYGANNPGFTASYSGFVLGQNSSALSGSLSLSSAATNASDAGTYSITPSGLSSSNYNITNAAGTLTVNPAPLTITANNASRTYGSSNPSFSASYSGFVLGQDSSILSGSLSLTTPATSSSNAGTYSITPSGLSNSNYSISNIAGTLTVNPAPLTVIANDASRNYGSGNPSFGASYSGFVLGQDSSVLNGSLALTTPATSASNIGSYSITPSGLSSSNYSITNTAGTLTVNPAPLTITANDASRTYGSSNPSFNASYSGFVLGQGRSALSGSLSLTTPATNASDAGTYSITPSGLSSNNYSITNIAGTLTVNPAALTITANNASRTYGSSNPSFSASYSGFVLGQNSSALSGSLSLSTAATSASPAGNYPIELHSTISSPNYHITLQNGNLSILSNASPSPSPAPAPSPTPTLSPVVSPAQPNIIPFLLNPIQSNYKQLTTRQPDIQNPQSALQKADNITNLSKNKIIELDTQANADSAILVNGTSNNLTVQQTHNFMQLFSNFLKEIKLFRSH
jgi:filamentous hemagglutinin family protein